MRIILTSLAAWSLVVAAAQGQSAKKAEPVMSAWPTNPTIHNKLYVEGFEGRTEKFYLDGFEGHSWKLLNAQEPRDSVYQRARELLNRGEYRRSADLFREFRQKNADSRYAAPAMYWQAFALYRVGGDADLRAADELLTGLRQQSTKLADDSEVRSLATRIAGALAARGDAGAARRLRESTGVESGCDREENEIKAEALSALLQADATANLDILRRVLAKKDDCSAALRRRAVYHLNRIGDAGARTMLGEVAATDPSPEVRGEAIGALAQLPGGAGLALIGPVLDQATDDQTLRAALSALSRVSEVDMGPLIRRMIERTDVSEKVRADAIRSLVRRSIMVVPVPARQSGDTPRPAEQARAAKQSSPRLSDADASFLKGLYERSSAYGIRRAIVEAMTYAPDGVRDGWVLGLLRNSATDPRDRGVLLSSLRRSEIPIEEVIKLYDGMTERESRSMLVGILGGRPEPAATDKLVDVAKRGTDPSIRREAIAALARKNDPRATKLLLELVEH